MKEKSRKDDLGIEVNINYRWETGADHHPESEKLMKELSDIDLKYNSDYFCWKYGGDGDNGETLMYLLDIIFERRDRIFELNFFAKNAKEND